MSGRPPCAVHGPGLGDALGRTVTRMLEAALAAADPTAAVARTLPSLALPTAPGTIVVIAIGKAAAAMARPLVAALGRRVRHGVVVSKADVVGPIGPLQILRGDHPIPGAGSIAAGAAILAVLGRCAAGDTVVVALSGGASSLATVPVDGLSLSDLAGGTAALLRSGLDITAINAVRKHVDRLKGGGMACLAAPAKLVTLVLSDVVGDRLDTVASGPTVGDPTTWADAAAAIAAAGPAIPPALRTIVAQGVAGLRPETPDPADPRVATAVHHIVASNRDAVAAAVAAARAEGLLVEEGPPLRGEARSVGAALGRRVAGWPADRPRCVVLGGETTVTVTGTGVGGRNQELALAAALALQGRTQRCVVAFATDGEDGPTTAAGAVVDGQTVARAHARGIDLGEHLRRNDSHPALAASGALLHTGSPGTHATGTNVCDLAFGLLDPQRPLVLVTRPLPDAWLDGLRAGHRVLVGSDAPGWDDHLLAALPHAEGILALLTERIDDALLQRAPRLRVVSNMAVGVDNIDVDACTRRGIAVGHTPGVLTDATADLTFALLLMAARRLPEAMADARQGRWTTWSPTGWLGRDLHGATLGIVGLGKIGEAVARRARAFGMHVVYTARSPRPHAATELGAQAVSLPTLLATSDFVSLHVPLQPSTRHLIDASALRAMKRTAILVNTSRGAVVDSDALAAALHAGAIAAAALDVTDPEPLPAGHPLYAVPNLWIAPHIGSATVQTRQRMAARACENLVAGVAGRALPWRLPVAPPSA